MNYLEFLRLVFPEAHVTATALIVLALGVAKPGARGLQTGVALGGLAFAIVAVLRLPLNAALPNGVLVITPLTSLFKIICLVLAMFTVLISRADRALTRNSSEHIAVVLLATVGLLLLVGSEELLMIFIGLELTGLSLYVLTAFDKTDIRSAEAGMKYFLFGSTASAFTLFGFSLIYGMAGSTTLSGIAQKFDGAPVAPLLAAGVVMSLIGFAFKLAAAPFHLWAPDTYQGAPISSAAFIASGSKVASFFVAGKILLVGFAPLHGSAAWHAMLAGWTPLIAALAALSIVIGNFTALVQTNVRRLLAYSAVAHAGYTLLGLVAGGRDGFSATLFYTTIYALTLLGAFAVTGFVRRTTGGDDLKNFRGLSARSPLLAGCMCVFMLSLAGLPPLAGFFGKFYLFAATFRAGENHGLLWLIVLALFGSLVSLYYYLIVLKAVFGAADTRVTTSDEPGADWLQRATIAVLAIAVVGLGILPGILVERIIAALV
ncbi:MAG: NADH-quinone oxidoreductase subunit N [Verrucomicrobiota bacterium]|nr:NADH-quinone oxidoreductase subunit N [Verrucomicrobiota bacterium]